MTLLDRSSRLIPPSYICPSNLRLHSQGWFCGLFRAQSTDDPGARPTLSTAQDSGYRDVFLQVLDRTKGKLYTLHAQPIIQPIPRGVAPRGASALNARDGAVVLHIPQPSRPAGLTARNIQAVQDAEMPTSTPWSSRVGGAGSQQLSFAAPVPAIALEPPQYAAMVGSSPQPALSRGKGKNCSSVKWFGFQA